MTSIISCSTIFVRSNHCRFYFFLTDVVFIPFGFSYFNREFFARSHIEMLELDKPSRRSQTYHNSHRSVHILTSCANLTLSVGGSDENLHGSNYKALSADFKGPGPIIIKWLHGSGVTKFMAHF